MIVVESFFEAITSAPTTFTVLPTRASFLAFSARYLFRMPRGVSITRPAKLY
jgi:hypothetical protein